MISFGSCDNFSLFPCTLIKPPSSISSRLGGINNHIMFMRCKMLKKSEMLKNICNISTNISPWRNVDCDADPSHPNLLLNMGCFRTLRGCCVEPSDLHFGKKRKNVPWMFKLRSHNRSLHTYIDVGGFPRSSTLCCGVKVVKYSFPWLI